MGDLPFICLPSSLAVKIVALGIVMFTWYLQSGDTAESLYVSKEHGNDTANSCQNMTSPCKTLNHVISKASPNDVIMLDSTNTARDPYSNCSTETFRGSLSFVSWKGFAVINCSGGGLVFSAKTGYVSSAKPEVSFRGLTVFDTFLKVQDVSIQVVNCTFGSFLTNTSYLYIMDVLASPLVLSANVHISVNDTNFVGFNTAGCLRVINSATSKVVVGMVNVSIVNNTLIKADSVIHLTGLVDLAFANSVISNTKFPKYAGQPSVFKFNVSTTEATGKNSTGNRDISKNMASVYRQLLTSANAGVLIRFDGNGFLRNDAKTFSAALSAPAQVFVTNTTFSENSDKNSPGGLVMINSNDGAKTLEFHISNCWFNSNQKLSYTSLVNIIVGDSVVSNISLEKCHFLSNKNFLECGYRGTGPAVCVNARRLSLSVSSCEFQLNEAGAVYVSTSQRYGRLRFSQTLVNSSSFWDDVSNQVGAMVSVVFENYTGTTVSNWNQVLSGSSLLIEDCQFLYNRARMIGTGAVRVLSSQPVLYQQGSQPVANVTIRRSMFLKNVAQTGTGAIHLSSIFYGEIFDTILQENAGSLGGALYVDGGRIVLRNCMLENNFGGYTISTSTPGSLRLTRQGTALIQDSTIIQGRISQSFGRYLNFHGGVGVSSSKFGSISLWNSSFDFCWSPAWEKTIVMEIAQTKDFILDNLTTIRCPQGYDIREQTLTGAAGISQSRSFECNLCSMGTYSEDRGSYSKLKQHNVDCLFCPYGAKCMKGLHALPNFWGYWISKSNPARIAFVRCPLGYCCQADKHHKSCFPYDTCNSYRNGTLCGECKPGYSETLLTPSCRKSKKCNDLWFWPVAVLFVLGFSLYLVIEPDVIAILWNCVTWFTRGRPARDEKAFDPGYERIVFFYYQATDVLLVQSSYDLWDRHLSQFVLGVFNFEVRLNKEGFACPFPGLNPVSKVFFHSLGVFSVLFAIAFLFVCHCLLCFCLKREIPRTGRYLAAFLKGMILGYAVLAEKSMKLLKCVTVDGVDCLFLNCNIRCYTWWQNLIITAVVVCFIPFALVLFFGCYKLFEKKISVLHFFLACFFPLPFLCYWFITRQSFRTKHVPDSEGRDAVIHLLTSSYRVPDHVNRGAIYWQGVFVTRMLILILCNVLIHEPFLRSLTLLFICIINLCLHIYVLPFQRVSANWAETVSLFCLVLMAMFSLPFMGYLSEGVVPSGPVSQIMKIFSWCQAVLVLFLPSACIILALVALVSQVLRLTIYIMKCCHCSWRLALLQQTGGELADALITI